MPQRTQNGLESSLKPFSQGAHRAKGWMPLFIARQSAFPQHAPS